jgi:hypothetical protein
VFSRVFRSTTAIVSGPFRVEASEYRGDRGGGAPDKSSQAAGQVFEPERPHKSFHDLGRRPETKTLVKGLEAPRTSDMPSKSVGGLTLAGGFDSRPPPLLKAASDQPLREEAGVGRPRKGLNRSSGARAYHTSLSVFASRGTGQVFRRPAGAPGQGRASLPALGDVVMSAIGLESSIAMLSSLGFERIGQHARRLATYLVDGVAELGWRPFRAPGDPSAASHIVSRGTPIAIRGDRGGSCFRVPDHLRRSSGRAQGLPPRLQRRRRCRSARGGAEAPLKAATRAPPSSPQMPISCFPTRPDGGRPGSPSR